MDERERYLAQERIIDRAIRELQELEEDPGIPIAWVLLTANRGTEMQGMDRVVHAYFCPQGQPSYATVGILMHNLDVLRGIGGVTWVDET